FVLLSRKSGMICFAALKSELSICFVGSELESCQRSMAVFVTLLDGVALFYWIVRRQFIGSFTISLVVIRRFMSCFASSRWMFFDVL
ncbi:19599_t:CDS:2, partial [Dentiscutata erythropus]